jgi:serine/threonine protein kinase
LVRLVSLPCSTLARMRKITVSSDHIAIDFIDKLLAKDPATRMTLTEALQHPWLNEGLVPDSQPLASSFDFDSRTPRSTTNTAGPSTSATEDASEDFSYPMTKLHIETPGLDRTIPNIGSDSFCSDNNDQLVGQSSSFWGNQPRLSEIQLGPNGESFASAVSESNPNSQEPSRVALLGAGRTRLQLQPPRSLVLQQSPPSPPLTDSAMDDNSSLPAFIQETPGTLPDFIEETPSNLSVDQNSEQRDIISETDFPPQLQDINRETTVFMTPLTASSTGSILKRKRSDASMASNESSDLSPVPESQANRFAESRAANATIRMSSAETTPKGTKRRTTTAKPSPVPTRSSARIRATQNSSSGPNSPRTPKTTPRAKKI